MLSAFCARQTYRRIIQFGEVYCVTKPSCISRLFNFSRASSYESKKIVNENVTRVKRNVTDDFKIIYKFPHIAFVRGLCRLKIYQSTLTFLAVPFVGYSTHIGTLTSQALISTVCISGLAFFMLCVMGEIFRKIIGHIYYSSGKDLVKISHLTFWGGRQDIIVPAEDLVPFSDTTENPRDIYIRVLRYSQPKNSLYLCLRFGGITDIEHFNFVFGDLQENKKK